MPSNAFALGWPGKFDGEAVTLCSGERFALVDLAPLTFLWRPALDEPALPSFHGVRSEDQSQSGDHPNP